MIGRRVLQHDTLTDAEYLAVEAEMDSRLDAAELTAQRLKHMLMERLATREPSRYSPIDVDQDWLDGLEECIKKFNEKEGR